MSNREHAHALIDRLPEAQLSALVGLLETIADPVVAPLRNAPMDDEQQSDQEKQKVAEAATGSSAIVTKVSRMKKRCAGSN